MVTRLMDLVVLVAELSQKDDKSFKDLDEELGHRGYSADEIEQALFWISSQWQPVDRRAMVVSDATGVRVLSPWEAHCMAPDAFGYLIRLLTLGIVDGDQLDRILSRITPLISGRVSLSDVKAIAGAVVFNLGGEDAEDEYFEVFDEDIQTT